MTFPIPKAVSVNHKYQKLTFGAAIGLLLNYLLIKIIWPLQ